MFIRYFDDHDRHTFYLYDLTVEDEIKLLDWLGRYDSPKLRPTIRQGTFYISFFKKSSLSTLFALTFKGD